MRRITTVAIATILTVATACSNTAKGVAKDAEKAGDQAAAATEKAADATASTAGNAGAAVGAAMETADVKTALLADTRISAIDINVDTNKDTKTVTLKGSVPTSEQKAIAEEVAKMKAPDYKVINALTVKPAK